jgi:hypothetical protein
MGVQGTVNQLFVNIEKAYGAFRKEVLYNIPTEFAILMKLVRIIIKMCLSDDDDNDNDGDDEDTVAQQPITGPGPPHLMRFLDHAEGLLGRVISVPQGGQTITRSTDFYSFPVCPPESSGS